MAVKRLSSALKEALAPNGSVLCLNSTSIGLLFPTASERLDVLFYRCGPASTCARTCVLV